MEPDAAGTVEAILTAILQWRVAWLEEQKKNSIPPPICRTQARKLKITYDNYKDYESTFVPLLMHEIWAQIFEEWTKLEIEMNGGSPMDIDDDNEAAAPEAGSSSSAPKCFLISKKKSPAELCPRRFWVGVSEYRAEKSFHILIRCQCMVDSNKVNSHMRLIGEGDLVRMDLVAVGEFHQPNSDCIIDPQKKTSKLSLFGYVIEVNSERHTRYTTLAECFTTVPKAPTHIVTYQVLIAKRPLRLDTTQPMQMSGIYYLKPMIRQIESVAMLKDSALAKDILSPRTFTCRMTLPTITSIKSPHYNDMQYKAIIGANEALVRNLPKIQLIQGPPGTGKTHTLIGLIKHFYTNWTDASRVPKLLICAPSNGGIDEVARRLYPEREFLKRTAFRRSLRIVRVGHPDQIAESVKNMSLEELVDANSNQKVESVKKKHSQQVKEIEDELGRCDTEIANLRYAKRFDEVPSIEAKIATLLKQLENAKANEEVSTKRETSEASKRQIRFELVRNADVILTTLNSCQRHPLDALFRPERSDMSCMFHCVIVDEASQCCEPELLMPLCYKINKMILIGDPMQLPATVISKHAQDFDFGRSLFERFFIHFGGYSSESPIAMLTEQYRMHPEICKFPSKQFYDNRLISARMITSKYPIRPYVMFDLRHGVESKSKTNKMSLENEVEAGLVRNILVAILTKAPEKTQIGVITPYKGQKRLITNKISSLQSQRQITIQVNTCDGFQGQEKDIIILSCVRAFDSGRSVGFLKSPQRINVALTRAKHSLIICVSTKSLSNDKTWKALIDDANERRAIETLTQTPSVFNLGKMISNMEELSRPINPKPNLPALGSRLIRTNGSSDGSDYVPEFIIPMDID